jgi:hypothetical protein
VPRAVLEITADTSGIAAAFGAIRTMAQQTEREVKGSMQRAATGSANAYRTSARQQATDGDQASARGVAAANRSVQAFIRAEDQKRRAARLTAQTQQRVEQEATAHARVEASKRGLTAEQESRVKQTAAERLTRVYETEEKRQTAIAQREVTARNRNRSSVAHDIRRGLTVGRDAGINVARNAQSQIQDARQQRAESEHTLNNAFMQAGNSGVGTLMSAPEAAALRGRLQTEVTTGSLRGLSMSDVAEGLSAAQTQRSVLTDTSAQGRAAALEEQIRLMAFARNTGQTPREVLLAAATLKDQGITGSDQMSTLMTMTGIGQGGSVELSTMIGRGLGPLMQNIARVRNPNQTPEQRSAAVRATVLESMSVAEVEASAGANARPALNSLAQLRGSVESPLMADRLDRRLRATNHAALADQMIVRDRAGNASLRNRSPVAFMSSLIAGMRGDANATMNLLATGGPGAPMILGSPQRTAINLLAGASAGGGTIAEKVADLQAQGARFGTAQVEAGRGIIDSEQRTALQSSEESRLTALSDNTSSINQLSNSFAEFVARNPLGATVAATAVPLGGQVAAGFIGRQLAGTALGTALGVAAPAGGAAAGGGGALAVGGAVLRKVLGAPALLGSLLTLGGSYGGVEQEDVQAQQRAGREYERQSTRLRAEATAANLPPPTAEQIGAALVAALRAAPVVATVSPVDATHARTQATTR